MREKSQGLKALAFLLFAVREAYRFASYLTFFVPSFRIGSKIVTLPKWKAYMGIQNISFSSVRGWKGYLARLSRLYAKIKIKNGRNLDVHDRDDYFFFFYTAYHLKEWLENEVSGLQQDLKTLFDKLEMRVLQDICNLDKHRELTRKNRIDKTISIHQAMDWLDGLFGERKRTEGSGLVDYVTAGDESHKLHEWPIFELARAIYGFWLEFLMEKGLIFKNDDGSMRFDRHSSTEG